MSLLSRLAVQAARAYGILSSKAGVSAEYLVVAGGGGGGKTSNSGGGGAGGMLTSTATLSTLNTYSITVGAGGNGATSSNTSGSQGANSVISGTGLSTITAIGGGYGGHPAANGGNGGSGGGAGYATKTGGTGTVGQGNNGGNGNGVASAYSGGGGGGAGAAGGNGTGTVGSGVGGAGLASSISGSSVTYAGGGGAGNDTSTVQAGGSGGGGNGGAGSSTAATAGTANRGGGGGGSSSLGDGASGGSGIVIISYTATEPKFVGGTITTSGGKQIHTFTSSGTLSPITPITASYLVVAGGGGGGGATTNQGGGGGGAGGLQASSTTLYSGATYVVTVGAGGTGGVYGGAAAGSGSNSVVSGTGLTTLTSSGGGGGGVGPDANGSNGGSGGGGGSGGTLRTGGTGTSGQGNNGGQNNGSANYAAGGGGGAGAAGGDGGSVGNGNGGNGSASSISGTSVTYAGGGGAGKHVSASAAGTGGTGGGGNGGSSSVGVSGTTNLGGGGGGGSSGNVGGAGGSGIVIISYAGSQAFNGGLVTSSGGNTIHTFTSTGALTPLTNNLNNSLRFRSSASAYLSRTPTLAGNRRTWTWSGWVKRGALGISGTVVTSRQNGQTDWLTTAFTSSDTLQVCRSNGGTYNLVTTQVFRDPSAWYHIVIAWDTTQATAANRVKLYVNGNQVTAFGTANYPAQNYDGYFNTAVEHEMGAVWAVSSVTDYFDGYMTDINFIDGQALEPYYFGNNDANGVWKPIQYKGTYGTNGFYLNFADTSALTTSSNAGLGKDTSGNGNYWTTNNISITSGTTYDAMTDVPTNTSATVANYAVLNPLDSSSTYSISSGNLNWAITASSSNTLYARATMAVSSGKWYWEITPTDVGGGGNVWIGIQETTYTAFTGTQDNVTSGYAYKSDNGNKAAGSTLSSYGASYTNNDVIGVALDMDAGTLTFYKNNTSQGTAFSSISGTYRPLIVHNVGSVSRTSNGNCNFGQRPFNYSAPSGFLPLNTYNLA